MNRFIVLILCTNIIFFEAFSQNHYELTGTVFDENNQGLNDVLVSLYPIDKTILTDAKGNFSIKGLSSGRYIVSLSFIGFHSQIDTIYIDRDYNYRVSLKTFALSLSEVTITDNYIEQRKQSSSMSIEIVDNNYLKQNQGGSLMKSLEQLPGISTIDIGSGNSKPVIRGLGFNRVIVIETGIKHEGQQWGADHGLEIDQYSIDNIEIIKGPASLIYGSDAIAGVIDINRQKIPETNTIGGKVEMSGKSNNDFVGTSISLFGRHKIFFADARITILNYGDYKVPTDSVDIYSYRAGLYKNHLRNTAGNERNMHLSLGIIQNNFRSKLFVSNIYSKNGFFANAHGLEPRLVDAELHDNSNRDINYPYQEVSHLKIINTNEWFGSKYHIDVNVGLQRNFRQEWSPYTSHGYMPAFLPDKLGFSTYLERGFEKYIYSANAKITYFKNKKTQLIVGIDSDVQDNRIDGRNFIIPSFWQLNTGTYTFFKYNFTENSNIQSGIRYDYGYINSERYYDWFASPVATSNDTTFKFLERANNLNRNFSNISWSVGYVYNPKKWSLKANIGKSFRMPIAKELSANGVNYHHFSYEIGDPSINSEISYQFDATVIYKPKKLSVGLTPFFNYFPNYIFLNPSSEHDMLYGNGNQVYYYTQSKVLRYGGEIYTYYKIIKSLELNFIGEYIYAEQLSGAKKGFSLPFSPPTSASIGLKYEKEALKLFRNIYYTIDYKITAAQKNIVPPEEITDSYQVCNIGLGGDINLQGQRISLFVQIRNLFNKKYFNHTSYYRLINVPEAGRNFIINVSIPFSRKIK